MLRILLCLAFLQANLLLANNDELDDFQKLSLDKKMEDFNTIVGGIEEYYAMLSHKEEFFKDFNWEKTKKDYLAKIQDEKIDNAEFGALLQELVATLKDAHTSAYSYRDVFQDGFKISIATLGFLTTRKKVGEEWQLVVDRVLPKFFPNTVPPVQAGDELVTVNGVPAAKYAEENVTRYHNLGQPESNKTYAAMFLSVRPNLYFASLPTGKVDLVVKRGDKSLPLSLPWIKTSPKIFATAANASTHVQSIVDVRADGSFVVAEKNVDLENPMEMFSRLKSSPRHMKVAAQPRFQWLERLEQTSAAVEVKGDAIKLGGLAFNLVKSPKGIVAVYRIEDFMFSRLVCGEPIKSGGVTFYVCKMLTGEDYANAFSKLKALGVTNLVLDLRSNGGGFLDAGYELLRAFSSNALKLNLATLKLNEEWLGEFAAMANYSFLSVTEQEAYKQIHAKLLNEANQGARYSSPISIMGPEEAFGVANAWEGKTFILADEMCASMCDIFTTLMQDHKKATFIGKQTMGAGGNVIGGPMAPHSKVVISLTASRMYRLDGSTIENNGAKPDVAIDETVGGAFWTKVLETVDASR